MREEKPDSRETREAKPVPPRPGAGVPLDFIRQIVADDVKTGKNGGRVHTRFPPEPNGYLHIGHAKAILLNYGIAQEFGGKFNLRFDDTNPAKEEQEFVDAIMDDMRWLGVDWEDRLFFASDYFEQLYEWAEHLITQGKAYVCDLSAEEMSEYRGTAIETEDGSSRLPAGTARTATGPSRRTSTSSAGCALASSPTARGRCARRSTWPTRT